MQANCPQCSNKIVIDDARVPDRAFSVKCPKCQNAVKFPGKGAAAAPPPSAPAASEPPPDASASATNGEEARAQMMAQLRREMALTGGDQAHAGERALVALADRGHAGNVTLMLTRLGYHVDTIEDVQEAARLLEQGVYATVVTAPVAGAPGKESVYQKACRLNPELRRRFFLVLVADNLKSADGTQAFVLQADLTLTGRDAGTADVIFRNTQGEKQRLYQVFTDAKRRADHQAGYI